MADTAKLTIRVETEGAASATTQLDKTTQAAQRTEKATDGLIGTIKRLAAAYLTLATAAAAGRKLFSVTKEYQVLNAQVETAVGNIEDAAIAFQELRDVQGPMPFELDEVTASFTKLVNLGLDPSRRALNSYANTATALATSLDAVTDAVVQATQGQFRGLAQLGVKATETQEGIALTFRGVTTNIRKDVNEIQQYLIELGENNFADAMANRSKTLEGAVSDLTKAWNEFFLAVAESGGADFLASGIRMATSAIEELRDTIASGELQTIIAAIGAKFSGWGEDISATFQLFEDEAAIAGEVGIDVFAEIGKAIRDLPENVRFFGQSFGATLAFISGAVGATVAYIWERFQITFDQVIGLAVVTGKQIANALNPFAEEDYDFTDEIGKLASETTQRLVEANQKLKDAINNVGTSTAEVIDQSLAARDAAVASFDEQIKKAKELRAEYEANRKARMEASAANDPLSRFGSGSSGGNRPLISNDTVNQFNALKAQLQLEETTIEESYRRRLELIRANTEEGTALRFTLEESLEAQVAAEYDKAARERVDRTIRLQEDMNAAIAEGRLEELDALRAQLEFEETMISDSYLKRRNQILQDTNLTEQQRLDALAKNESAYTARQRQLELARTKIVLQNSEDLFKSLADLAETSVGKQNAIYKVAFAASKAFAIADSIVHIQQGIAAAASTPFPANIAAMASVAAATASIVSTITETVLAFEHGGMIPAGRFGIVGETGTPEIVRGPAMVTSARTTADLMANRSDGSKPVVVNVYNQGDASVEVQQRETDSANVIDLIVRRVKREVAGDITRGGDPISNALRNSYNLRRGAA